MSVSTFSREAVPLCVGYEIPGIKIEAVRIKTDIQALPLVSAVSKHRSNHVFSPSGWRKAERMG